MVEDSPSALRSGIPAVGDGSENTILREGWAGWGGRFGQPENGVTAH